MDTTTPRKKRSCEFSAYVRLTVALITLPPATVFAQASEQASAASVSIDQPMGFDIPRLSVDEAGRWFHRMTGVNAAVSRCGDLLVGPLSGVMSPTQAWAKLLGPLCLDAYAVDDRTLVAAPFGDREYEFDIAQQSRIEALAKISKLTGLLLGYSSSSPAEEDEPVGPIIGRLSLTEAIKLSLEGSNLVASWMEPNVLSIEPLPQQSTADRCPCSQPITVLPPMTAHVTVFGSIIPTFSDAIMAPVLVFDRDRIDQIGAATIPELLTYASQTTSSRSEGFSVSGAQYAEMRGLGADTVLVLINGRRAYASANEISANGFDLNTIPISAVERIEISFDSTSLPYGTDAIGGVVNIVLKHEIEGSIAELRLGTADGGAEQRRFTYSEGVTGDAGRATWVLDYFELGDLPGYERDRWANQDWTHLGGSDNRTRFGSPANVSSIDGSALPGLQSSTAALRPSSNSSSLQWQENETNVSSLYAYQSILPKARRASAVFTGDLSVGASMLFGEALLVRRESTFTFFPNPVFGVVSGDHPQNAFGEPVYVQALLTGMPSPRQRVESALRRAVIGLEGPVHHRLQRWHYSVSLVDSYERTKARLQGLADPSGLAQSLLSSEEDQALNVFSLEPGSGDVPDGVLLPNRRDDYSSTARQFAVSASGPVSVLPGWEVTSHVGIEKRRESVRFESQLGEVSRDVTSTFLQLHVPVVDALSLTAGVRSDEYSDVTEISRRQLGLTWRPYELVKFHASVGESLRPPSLFDLHFPRLSTPTQIFDPDRNEVVPIVVITGGNPDLKPTTGWSSNIGITVGTEDDWRISLDRWEIDLSERISLLSLYGLITNDGTTGRVKRASASEADEAAGLPGPITEVDISRINFGDLTTSGIDFSAQARFASSRGEWTPRLEVTVTNDYRYRELPGVPMADRVGIASMQGTIPRARVVGSLTYEGRTWRATLFGRYREPYKDWSALLGAETSRRITSSTVWDFNVSRKSGEHWQLSFGVMDLLDKDPPYSDVSAAGFDPTQYDLKGRRGYLLITGTF